MAFGAVHVPGPSGPDFVKVKTANADDYAAGKMLAFGEIQKRQLTDIDRQMAGGLFRFGELHTQQQLDELYGEVTGEVQTVTLTNTKKFPFNSTVDSPVTVALTKVRRNLFYTVDVDVTAKSGIVDEIFVTDKALNGFKLSYTGSAASVTVTARIKGGMT